MTCMCIREFPQIRGTFSGVPIVKIIVFGSPYLGPPILGNYHTCMCVFLYKET